MGLNLFQCYEAMDPLMNLPLSPYPVSLNKFFSAKRAKQTMISGFSFAWGSEIHDNTKHRLAMSNVAKPWPSYRVLDDLVDKASGQFIYPATVLKFVDDPNYRPTDCLDIIVSIPVISPSA